MLEGEKLYEATINVIDNRADSIYIFDNNHGLQRMYHNVPQYKKFFVDAWFWITNCINQNPAAYRIMKTDTGYTIHSNEDTASIMDIWAVING